jgi:hypothetical protein
MLRRTQRRLIVPMQHAFVPGGRPSERGMMYRNSNINRHCQIGPIQNAQRTWKESKIFAVLMLPDQIFAGTCLLFATSAAMLVLFHTQPFSFNRHKNKWLVGGLNQHEMFQRNEEMAIVLEKHRQELENTRKIIGGTPDIFKPAGAVTWKNVA